jgi:cell division protein FtsN
MGMVIAFILGCLVTIWWKSKPHDQKANRKAKPVTAKGNPNVNKAIDMPSEQRNSGIRACKVPNNPVIDDELREVLLEYMVEQIKKGKIKLVEDAD